MQLYIQQQDMLLRKIGRRKDEIRNHMISNRLPITDIVYRETPDFERYEDAVRAADYAPIRVGDRWGGGINGWFKMRFVIPADWRGREVAAYINLGGEACAFVDGKPYQGVDNNHEELLLTRSARGGESFEIVLDAMSHIWHQHANRPPVTFSRAEIATRNPEVQDYWFNLEILHLLAEQLPQESPRRAKIIYLLSKSVDAFDYTNTDEASLKKSALRANAILQPLLECRADASATNVAVHGHSHIDVAWLWPYRETKRKCARTFSTVMRMMEQYPEYVFSQSQAQLYEFTRQNYPALYEDIKKRVKEGRWDVTGSMWVEADCNLCSGESLIRQILVGKNFYKDEFGIETDVLWLPDVFGYSAALPQILKRARVNYFSTIKINWSQFNHFPYNTFYWQGIDGTRILSHFPPTTDYNAYPEPRKLIQQVRDFAEKDRCDWSLLSYGWGDGGGGPDRRHLEFLRRSKDLEGLPRCRQMKVSEFFHKIDGCEDLPVWVGELYLELHRGTYTTQARNKRYNRRCELLYRDAELWSSVAAPAGHAYPYQELHKQWRRILCNQFHDVIPGSSIREVYEDTDQMYPEILAVGEKAAGDALAVIAANVDTSGGGEAAAVVFNSLPWERSQVQHLTPNDDADRAVVGPDGKEVPVQAAGQSLAFLATAPPMGYSVYHVVKKRPARTRNELRVSRTRLENRFCRIELDSKGAIRSLVHKQTGREVVRQGERLNLLRLYEDKPNDFDAWDIDFFHDEKWEDVSDVQSIQVLSEGPLYAELQIARKFGKSQLRQTMRVYADNPRIDFVTWVDWHEDHKCLKALFPVDVNASEARYEIQFGNVERPTHSNTSWDFAKFEVAAHRWADISEEGFGVSLMNDCKYGHQTAGSEMRLTLLRSPKEPDYAADMGEHTFTYSLMPHAGDYIDAGTVRRGYELNVDMRTVMTKPSKGVFPKSRSFFSVDATNVVLETVKKAEREDATVLRLYECHNRRSKVSVKVGIPFKRVYECDLMEDNIASVSSRDGSFEFEIRPFEIRTFKVV